MRNRTPLYRAFIAICLAIGQLGFIGQSIGNDDGPLATGQDESRFEYALQRGPSPNARGPLATVVIHTPPWTHSHYSFEQAMNVDSVSLACGYLEVKYILGTAQLARKGATVYTWANGTQEMVDTLNANDFITKLERRLVEYGKAIRARGYQKLDAAYDVTAGDEAFPTLIEQEGFEFKWSVGASLHSGVTVENAIAIENAGNPEITFIGDAVGKTFEVRTRAVGIAAQSAGLGGDTVTWTSNLGKDPSYADAYVGRAFAYFQDGDCRKALADTSEAQRRDPRSANAFGVLAQILSSCEDPSCRDGQRALEAAERYCQLTSENPADEWYCYSLLAAAHAEMGDFEKAMSAAEVALELAPDDFDFELQQQLQLYQDSKPLRRSAPGS